ncbi:hypothetical protein [Streptomyces sp. NPDC003023]|uniref:hypothetical protein n=1 Tax=Streptomyces sp. NPDC003023 TaxID=3364675 RepID=UPI00369BC33A
MRLASGHQQQDPEKRKERVPARRARRTTTMTSRAWAVLAASVVSVGLGGAAVSVAVAEAEHSGGVVVHRETRSPEEIREFWTPERMREADGAPMPVAPVRTARPAECSDGNRFVHAHCR